MNELQHTHERSPTVKIKGKKKKQNKTKKQIQIKHVCVRDTRDGTQALHMLGMCSTPAHPSLQKCTLRTGH